MPKNKTRIAAAAEARERADWDYEDSIHPREDWQYEVANGDTQLGYFDWVIHKLDV